MPKQDTTHHRPNRPVRIENELWEPFGAFVGDRHRSEDIREYIRWKLRLPGAKQPKQVPIGWTPPAVEPPSTEET